MLDYLKNKLKKILLLAQKYIKLDLVYITKHGFWITLNNLIAGLAGIAIAVAFARFTTREHFGLYQMIISLLTALSVISLPGINTTIFQGAVDGNDGTYRQGVKLSFLWSLLAIPIFAAIAIGHYLLHHQNDIVLYFILTGLFFPFIFAPNSWTTYWQGRAEFFKYSIYNIVKNIFTAVAIVAAILFSKDNLLIILLSYLIVNSLFNLIYHYLTTKLLRNNQIEKNWKSYGIFLTKMNVLATIAGNIDNIMVGTFLGLDRLAIYAAGMKLVGGIQMVLKSLTFIAAPKIAKSNTIQFRKQLTIFLIVSMIAAVTFILTPWLIKLLFSNNYNSSIIVTRIVVIFLPFWFTRSLLENHLVLFIKNKKKQVIFNVLSPIFYMIIAIPLLILMQEMGFALSQGLNQIIAVIILLLLVRKTSI